MKINFNNNKRVHFGDLNVGDCFLHKPSTSTVWMKIPSPVRYVTCVQLDTGIYGLVSDDEVVTKVDVELNVL